MPCISRVRRTLPLPWAARGGSGSRRWRHAGVRAAVGVVVLVVLVVLAVGGGVGVVGPSRPGRKALGRMTSAPVGTLSRSFRVIDTAGMDMAPVAWKGFPGRGSG